MTITQETANLVDTLARAASQIGSTPASAKIQQLIVDLLPATSEQQSSESIVEALRQDYQDMKNRYDRLLSFMNTIHDQVGEIYATGSEDAQSAISEISDLVTGALFPSEPE